MGARRTARATAGGLPKEIALHPASFATYASGGKWSLEGVPHLGVISDALRDVALGKIPRLLIQTPPRCGKSELVSKYFPAWYIGASLTGRIILTSYESDFAASWGRKARDVLEEHGDDVFGVRVSSKSAARDEWELEAYAGAMKTAGVGAGILGRGANVAVIDDPIKNAQEAMSKLKRDRTWDWYVSTLLTRLEPEGAVVIIMQRWHEDDLAGRVLDREGTVEEGGEWLLLNFPALAEEGDLLGREPGEPLWPSRYPKEVLLAQKERDNYWFASQYQQRPQPLEGGLFERRWINYFYPSIEPNRDGNDERVFYLDNPEIPTRVRQADTSCFLTMDIATSTGPNADYTVASVWRATFDGDLLLEDVIRKRIPLHEQMPLLMRINEQYRPYAIYIEQDGLGLAAVQAAKSAGLPIIGVSSRGKGPKEARAIPAAERMRMGKIYFRAYAPWEETIIEELLTFPTGRHDDFADTMSMAAENMTLTGPPLPSLGVEATKQFGPYRPRRLY